MTPLQSHDQLHDVAIPCIKPAQLASLSSFYLSALANSLCCLSMNISSRKGRRKCNESQSYILRGRQPIVLINRLHRRSHFPFIAPNQPLNEYNRASFFAHCTPYASQAYGSISIVCRDVEFHHSMHIQLKSSPFSSSSSSGLRMKLRSTLILNYKQWLMCILSRPSK